MISAAVASFMVTDSTANRGRKGCSVTLTPCISCTLYAPVSWVGAPPRRDLVDVKQEIPRSSHAKRIRLCQSRYPMIGDLHQQPVSRCIPNLIERRVAPYDSASSGEELRQSATAHLREGHARNHDLPNAVRETRWSLHRPRRLHP